MVAIPSRSSSSALVNDQERRVHREMEHLLSDIRRINPQGAPHCTFGELFIDPGVEQYYEALVGTMRAAKRNKLITFKGQFLLKGMHDDVIVRIVDGNDDGTAPVNNETTIASASGDNTTKAPSEAQTHDHNRRTTQRRKISKPVIVLDKNLKQSIFRGNMNLCKNDDDASVATEPSRMPYRANLRTRSMIIGGRHHTRIAQIAHTVSAGIAFQSNQNTETHFERVDREVNQLLVDILRIAPEGNPFCTFGLLFEDPQVEQYYEALVGTLKSAKRKGLIRFKGQMLLKGMHDNVQIDIVK
eukprot:CAMPEP_0198261880 /NCGR_PEP_ID=MMETSP1447-20131203/10510_1 /TAXON_ID=420782 /ORGANISM="Chaetoceros dichaeta, Strain CCMP1751" /LENGTH=299 /DNA_ID=CAMNT_0043949935 /DNA_START=58 /DNA_END=957 /DNA_ORIENTATION=+